MQVKVNYLKNLQLEACFDDFKVLSDQPIRYKGDGQAPGPFDYFLASSAMCAAYFAKVYCKSRNIPTEDLKVYHDNTVDPDNRYKQAFHIQIELPGNLSEKDKNGILAAMERCTVKRVIQNEIDFHITLKDQLGTQEDSNLLNDFNLENQTMIKGKDCSLEDTLKTMGTTLNNLGIKIEIASWRNQVPHVWSVHVRDADSPLCFSNGKGATKEAALCSALGEYLERLSCNYFYNDYYLTEEIAKSEFVHYPNEKWFSIPQDGSWPKEFMDEYLISLYEQGGELKPEHLLDTNAGLKKRGICALPFIRQSDGKEVFIPNNLIGNLFVSNGMSAGNSRFEARVQALSEIFERAVKNQIILEEICLPDIPTSVLEKYPTILEGIRSLEEKGFPIFVKDASLGGKYPVICVTLMNPNNGGVFASFGSHPSFEIALERSLTELLQGRSFEGFNDTFPPTFNEYTLKEHNNIIDHFIDSTGVISWKFFKNQADFEFNSWDFKGTTEEEFNHLMEIAHKLEKEVYIADYNDLGVNACRILIPDYSEIYQMEDLIWDNSNKAIDFREAILLIHKLKPVELKDLLERIDHFELDDFMPISELIGVAFDESTPWGQLVICELKLFIHIKLQNFDEAKENASLLNSFNDHSPERRKLFQLLGHLCEIQVLQEDINEYLGAFTQMYGEKLTNEATSCLNGENHFVGLTPTDLNLTGIDKHEKLIASYQKLRSKRQAVYKL